jgi:hypothetical protein
MTPISQAISSAPKYYPSIYHPEAALQAEYGRLIHAAIISTSFQKQLLSDPAMSIEKGFCGERFQFPAEIKSRIGNIHATNLEDFSGQLLQVTAPARIKEAALSSY